MGLGVVDRFVEAVRVMLGLPADSGQPPDLMRLGLYPARVDKCANDGSKCDVTPADTRVSKGEKNVEVLVGIPGASAVVEPGATVLLGWRRGDPASPYCMPAWALGATVDKLVMNANLMELAGNAFKALKTDDFLSAFSAFLGRLKTDLSNGSSGGCTTTSIDNWGPPVFAAATYESTKVKHG